MPPEAFESQNEPKTLEANIVNRLAFSPVSSGFFFGNHAAVASLPRRRSCNGRSPEEELEWTKLKHLLLCNRNV